MSRSEFAALRFVRAMLPAFAAKPTASGDFEVDRGDRVVRLAGVEAERLISLGVLKRDGANLRPMPEARTWLARRRAKDDPFLAQNTEIVMGADGARRDLSESPLARLAAPGAKGETPFLEPHQVEAGERLRRLAERARMVQRTTMSYDPTRAASGPAAGSRGSDVSDSAIDARRRLGDLLESLPRDCAGVVLDVCGLLKGLQTVETERGWPRRSAKLVLRIGLEQLAATFGLAPNARGPRQGRVQGWFEARPTRFE